jgi:Fe2+ transport system protein FeoA
MTNKCGKECPWGMICDACSVDQCNINEKYKLCMCNMDKEREDLLLFMGLSVGTSFKVTTNNICGVVLSTNNIGSKIALSKTESQKMYAIKS